MRCQRSSRAHVTIDARGRALSATTRRSSTVRRTLPSVPSGAALGRLGGRRISVASGVEIQTRTSDRQHETAVRIRRVTPRRSSVAEPGAIVRLVRRDPAAVAEAIARRRVDGAAESTASRRRECAGRDRRVREPWVRRGAGEDKKCGREGKKAKRHGSILVRWSRRRQGVNPVLAAGSRVRRDG